MYACNDTAYSKARAVANSNGIFTGKIYPYIAAQVQGKNLISSSYSISAVMGLLKLGARGATEEQIKVGMAYPEDDVLLEGHREIINLMTSNDNYILDSVNRLYIRTGFPINEVYLEKADRYFFATAENVDFEEVESVRTRINTWVETNTHDMIEELIPRGYLASNIVMILVNAVYFKGEWSTEFKPKLTTREKFHLSGGGTVRVDMMHRYGAYLHATSNKQMECIILELPYKGDRLSMFLFLSDDPKGFKDMEEKFTHFDFSSLENEVRKHLVDLYMPKFKVESTHYLNEPMKSLGCTAMFSERSDDRADFSALSDIRVKVNAIIQKVFIDVNEQGTEAGDDWKFGRIVTDGGGRNSYRPLEFECNRPFLFVIRDKLTGMIVFNGRVTNPNENVKSVNDRFERVTCNKNK